MFPHLLSPNPGKAGVILPLGFGRLCRRLMCYASRSQVWAQFNKTIDAFNNGPEPFQCMLPEGVEGDEPAFAFAIFTESDFPHLVGQRWCCFSLLVCHTAILTTCDPTLCQGNSQRTRLAQVGVLIVLPVNSQRDRPCDLPQAQGRQPRLGYGPPFAGNRGRSRPALVL